MATKLYINLDAKTPRSALVQSELVLTPVQPPDFTLGDTMPVELRLCQGGAVLSPSGYTVELSVGAPGTEPTSGTWSIKVGTNASSDLAYNATAAQIKTYLEADTSIGAGNVQVSGEFPCYTVEFIGSKANTAMGAATIRSESLFPSSQVTISERSGGGGYNELWVLNIQRKLFVSKTTWSTGADYLYGNLDLNTIELAQHLAGESEAAAVLEIELASGSNSVTAVQVPCTCRKSVDYTGSSSPVSTSTSYTSDAADLAFVQNRSAITGFTGGTSADLDSIPTVSMALETCAVIRTSTHAILYRLKSGTTAESSPLVIRPDDYAATTNEKVWKLQGIYVAGVYAGDSSFVNEFAGRVLCDREATFAAIAAPGSPNAGDVWQDSTQKTLRGYLAGISQHLVGAIYTQTAAKSISNTTNETSLIGTGVGTLTLPANFWVSGKTVRQRTFGYVSQASSTGTYTIRIKLGSTTVAEVGPITTEALTSQQLIIDAMVTCVTTGASSTFKTLVRLSFGGITDGATAAMKGMQYCTDQLNTVNSANSAAWDVTVQHSSASASNSWTTQVATVEVVS